MFDRFAGGQRARASHPRAGDRRAGQLRQRRRRLGGRDRRRARRRDGRLPGRRGGLRARAPSSGSRCAAPRSGAGTSALRLYWLGRARLAATRSQSALYVDALATDPERFGGAARRARCSPRPSARRASRGSPLALDTTIDKRGARRLYGGEGYDEVAYRPPGAGCPASWRSSSAGLTSPRSAAPPRTSISSAAAVRRRRCG